MLLMDTHVWIWFLKGDRNLKEEVKNSIEMAISKKELFICAISQWELAMLIQKSRIVLNKPATKWIDESIERLNAKIIPLTADIAVESTLLPGEFHGDPADRMIVATARLHQLTLVTRDSKIVNYGLSKHVKLLEA